MLNFKMEIPGRGSIIGSTKKIKLFSISLSENSIILNALHVQSSTNNIFQDIFSHISMKISVRLDAYALILLKTQKVTFYPDFIST